MSKLVKAIRMAIEFPDSLRQVLNSRYAVQQFAPVSLVAGFPCFCFFPYSIFSLCSWCLNSLSAFSRQLLTLLLPELTLLYHHSYLNPLLITQAKLTVECPFLNANCFWGLNPFSQWCALLPLVTCVPQKPHKFPCAPSLPPAGGTENMLN